MMMKHLSEDRDCHAGEGERKEVGSCEIQTLHHLKVVCGMSLEGWHGQREGLPGELGVKKNSQEIHNQEIRNGKNSISFR